MLIYNLQEADVSSTLYTKLIIFQSYNCYIISNNAPIKIWNITIFTPN